MKKYLLVTLLFFSYTSWSQTRLSDKDLERMIANAEKMANSVMKDPRYKKAMEEEGQGDELQGFPKRNPELLASIPAKPLAKPALSSYVKNLYTAYKTKLPVAAVSHLQQVEVKTGGDPDKLAAAAISNWYNGGPKEAILMALSASVKNPDDKLLLNNLSAMLNMGGASQHAIPILRTLVSEYPENPMLLNNLGQAFAGVGELDTAMYYFRRCIEKSPHHPEANNTAGQIEAERGNSQKAQQHFENSLKGGFNLEAANGLNKINNGKPYPLSGFIKVPVDLPYFNEFKYKLPRQSQSVDDEVQVMQEHEDYYRFIQNQASVYHELARQENRAGEALLEKTLKASLKNPSAISRIASPLNKAAMRMMMEIGLGLEEELRPHKEKIRSMQEGIENIMAEYLRKQEAISQKYADLRAGIECGEGNGAGCAKIMALNKEQCAEAVALGNNTQQVIAAAVVDRQIKQLQVARWVFKRGAYWGYLAGMNKHMANAAFYEACADYLDDLKEIAGNDPYTLCGRCGEKEENPVSKTESDNAKGMDCPIDITIPFVIGKVTLNCEKFSLSAGEGVTFNYEKDFKTKQSTMSIGAGLQFQVGKALGIFSGEVGVSAEQSLYIVFDGDNNISDAGLALKVEGSLGVEAGIDTPNGIGKELLTQEILDKKVEMGYTLGINSGWTFNEGSIRSIAQSMGGIFKK
jgi:tetratricopeptide (TPR) repeat protein